MRKEERREGGREGDRDRERKRGKGGAQSGEGERFSICWVLSHWLQHLGLGQAEDFRLYPGLLYGCKGPISWAIFHCFFRSQKLDQKRNSQDLNWHPYGMLALQREALPIMPYYWLLFLLSLSFFFRSIVSSFEVETVSEIIIQYLNSKISNDKHINTKTMTANGFQSVSSMV